MIDDMGNDAHTGDAHSDDAHTDAAAPHADDATERPALADFLNSPEMQRLREVFQARDREFDGVVTRLAQDGIVGTFLTTACPVQFEGTLPDGSHIYFRSRWDQGRLDVWAPGVAHEKPFVDATGDERMINNFDAITASFELEDDFDFAEASWLEHDEAEAAIRELVARWQAHTA